MKIKITPETELEKQMYKDVTHKGVQEFFIFGNKKDDDDKVEDFFDWKAGYRFLIGGLYYFINQITEEQNLKARERFASEANEIDIKPTASAKPMIKYGEVIDFKAIDTTPMEEAINKGKEEGKTVKFPMDNADEFANQPPVVNNESKGAEEGD